MSRITLHTLHSVPEAAKPFLENAQKNAGFIPNLLGVLANAPAALETYVTVSALNGKAELSLAEREVVQLVAATTHGCDFCVAGHTAVALNKAKLPDDVVSALRAPAGVAAGKTRSAGSVYARGDRHARQCQRSGVQRVQGGGLQRRQCPGSDPRGEPGHLVQLRQRLRPHAAQPRVGRLPLASFGSMIQRRRHLAGAAFKEKTTCSIMH